MTEQTTSTEDQKPQETEAKKPGRPAKGVSISNKSKRPITLIVSRTERETILPTQTVEVSKDFMAAIKKNPGAMEYFKSGDLVEV